MGQLSEQDLLRMWEKGRGQSPVGRMLTLLEWAYPEEPREALGALSLGNRDFRLFQIRAHMFGEKFPSMEACPNCSQGVEMVLDGSIVHQQESTQSQGQITRDGYDVNFRVPNSEDLEAMVNCSTAEEAKVALANRCLIASRYQNEAVTPETLPIELMGHIQQEITSLDPNAEILIDLICPDCRHGWTLLFDIATYVWTEITDYVGRLLGDIHLLARAYGWNEQEVMGLSSFRRRWYVEAVLA